MSSRVGENMRNSKGFTLIEVMIVVVIVGILASIAYPSYQEYVNRSNRAEGQAFLSDIAARQERYFSQNNAYVTADTDRSKLGLTSNQSANQRYTVSLSSVANDGGYTLTATPNFTETRCGNLVLNAKGVRSVSTGDKDYCWR